MRQLARAVAQLADVGASWDRRLQRIKSIAETIQRSGKDANTNTNQLEKKRERGTGR